MIDVRDENPRDWKAVYEIVSSAFGQLAEAELVEKLRGGDSVVSLVAEEDGQIVGHVLLSRMGAPFPALALAPVSVIPAKQRSGIGSALVKRAVNLARSEGWAAIFVLGDPNYYERFGFDKEATAGFTSPLCGRPFHGAQTIAIAPYNWRAPPRASILRIHLSPLAALCGVSTETIGSGDAGGVLCGRGGFWLAA